MADSNLTLRMSEELRARLEAARHQSHQTLSDFVIDAVTRRIDGACHSCGRDAGGTLIQSPGMSDSFAAWLRSQSPSSQLVSIATHEPAGPRVYTGRFTDDGIHDSYLSLRPEERGRQLGNPSDFIPIPRMYITMWESNASAEALRARLRNWGYQDITAMIRAPAPPPPTLARPVAATRVGAVRGRRPR
jgi:hypothetical protein